jgi:hypothetical protein
MFNRNLNKIRFLKLAFKQILDINVDSEVSFHDKSTGFLKFRNDELVANPLNTSLVFSIRTDQKRALFFYAHDQFDNFVQVS